MELWDLYTAERVPLGETHRRGELLPNGKYHLVVHVWIKNAAGEYLISRRAAHRPSFPHLYECVGGSVIAGETSLDGAIRETFEEVGLTLDPTRGSVAFTKTRHTIGGKRYGDILDVWVFETDETPDLARATTDETESAAFRSYEEIRALWDAGEMVPNLGYFFEAEL